MEYFYDSTVNKVSLWQIMTIWWKKQSKLAFNPLKFKKLLLEAYTYTNISANIVRDSDETFAEGEDFTTNSIRKRK